MNRHLFCLLFSLSAFVSYTQLLPTIGLNTQPKDTAKTCREPFYLGGNYEVTGYQEGNTVRDFKLYSLNGDSLQLSQALSLGKPVLLVAGSLTCPYFRVKVPIINQVISTYSNYINVYVIYTIEAHPTDTSVYSGFVNVTSQNVSQGILVPSPKTYGERKSLVDSLNYRVNLNAPVFIDGPCNNWWKKYGPAPYNSYLIGTNGVVLNKHGSFHQLPDDIFCDLDSIFNVNSGLCSGPPTAAGHFSLSVINNTVSGQPGNVLYDYVDIVNTNSVTVIINIKKTAINLPPNWETAFCADVCYGTTEDSIEVQIAAYNTVHFSLDFFTDNIADTGSVKVGFKNMNKPSNSFSMWLQASTLGPDIGIQDRFPEISSLKVYPNPATNFITVFTEEKQFSLKVYSVTGKEIYTSENELTPDTSQWPNGIYLVQLTTLKGRYSGKVIISK
jgi:hypothetical protein